MVLHANQGVNIFINTFTFQHPQQIPHSSQPVPFIRKEASQDVTDSQDIDHKVTVMVHRADNAHQSGQSLQTNQQIQQALVQSNYIKLSYLAKKRWKVFGLFN